MYKNTHKQPRILKIPTIVVKLFFAENKLEMWLTYLPLPGESLERRILSTSENSKTRVFNLYGVTEMSCWASYHEVKSLDPQLECDSNLLPIGQPLTDTEFRFHMVEPRLLISFIRKHHTTYLLSL